MPLYAGYVLTHLVGAFVGGGAGVVLSRAATVFQLQAYMSPPTDLAPRTSPGLSERER